MLRSQRGSTPLDAVVGIALLMLLTLGAMQMALTVYAHNAVRASAYEAARAAAEIGTSGAQARVVAEEMLITTTGKLIERARVSVSTRRAPEGPVVHVTITGRQRAVGPVPVSFPFRTEATALLERRPL